MLLHTEMAAIIGKSLKHFAIAAFLILGSGALFGDSGVSRRDRIRVPPPQPPENLNYQYSLCVCAVFKDEAPYFKEWIEYHKLLGVEHFRLYNNDSTDNYLEALEPYIRSGDVTLLEWPSDPHRLGPKEWVQSTQFPALSDAIAHFTGISKWLAIIDIDEFVVPLRHSDLLSFLEEYESEAGVLINWQNFGTSKVQEIPPDKLMIEMLTLRAKEKSSYNYPVKSIVRPERVNLALKAWCPHTWMYLLPQDGWILPNHQHWKLGAIDVNKVRINHYVHKTERFFHEVKIANKERMEGKKMKKEYIRDWKDSCNEVRDTEIFRFVPALRKRVFSQE